MKNLSKQSILPIIAVLFCNIGFCQLSFKAVELGPIINSGTAIASVDINGDDYPDLINIHNGFELWAGINTGQLKFIWSKIGEIQDTSIWSICVADVDNNKYNDIIVSGEDFGVVAFYQDSIGFKKTYLDTTPFFGQASTLFDVNRDGLLDLTVCNEFSRTLFYKNLGNRRFELDTSTINFSLNERDAESGNYGCIWSDFDDDGDPDLYISRCRPDVKDSTDRRRRNLFYYNNTNQFQEKSDLYSIGLKDQSWVSDFGDLDGDGLQDLVVLNHYSKSKIFHQTKDHHFEDVSESTGFDFIGTPIQISLQDFDNDMDLDIIVSGDRSEIWMNDGNMSFTRAHLDLISSHLGSMCIADFNQDGMLDLSTSFPELINIPTLVRDRIFISDKNINHFIGFSLNGISSNKNGIGTKIKLYTNNICQVRELRCGESFGIQNAQQVHFGLGNFDIIDSLIVTWPSGIIDRYWNINADIYYSLTENTCLTTKISLFPNGYISLCQGDTILLNAKINILNIVWNTGEKTSSIKINKEGIYYYKYKNLVGCESKSEIIHVAYNVEEFPKLNLHSFQIKCFNEEIKLSIPNYSNITWEDGTHDEFRTINRSGTFYGIVQGKCGVYNSDTLILDSKNELSFPRVADTTIILPAIINLESDRPNTRWYLNSNDTTPFFIGKSFKTPLIDKSTTYWVDAFDSSSYPSIQGGLLKPKFNINGFHIQTLNGGLYFKVHENCILDSVDVYTDRNGKRRILLQNDQGTILDSNEFDLVPGLNILNINFKLSSNESYYITTRETVNKKEFLTASPWLIRSNIDLNYPIITNDLVTINHSASGEAEYHYFYNWKLTRQNKICSSDRVPVSVILKNTSTQSVKAIKDILLLTSHSINLIQPDKIDLLCLYDTHGKSLYKMMQPRLNSISLDDLPAGVYFIYIKIKDSPFPIIEKFIVRN